MWMNTLTRELVNLSECSNIIQKVFEIEAHAAKTIRCFCQASVQHSFNPETKDRTSHNTSARLPEAPCPGLQVK